MLELVDTLAEMDKLDVVYKLDVVHKLALADIFVKIFL